MLLNLAMWLQSLNPEWGFLRVFQYLTFRAVMAAVTALLIGLVLGPFVIRKLTELKVGQPIREYGMQSHLAKRGTPTMGGALILLAIGLSTLLWFDWANRFVWIVMIVTTGFGLIGWVVMWWRGRESLSGEPLLFPEFRLPRRLGGEYCGGGFVGMSFELNEGAS